MISRRFNVKLTFIFIAFIGISVLGAGLIAADKLKQSHYESLRSSMVDQLHIIAAAVPWMEEGNEEVRITYFTQWAKQLKVQGESRVTFIAANGKVLGDSDHDPAMMDNHYDRPELADARNTGTAGFSDRHSRTVQSDMLYAAVPLHADGAIQGYIRLAAPLREIESYIVRLWSYLFIGLLLLFLAAGLVSYRVAKGISKPLQSMMNVAKQIAQSNYAVRVETKRRDEFGQLGRAINQIASSLQQQMVQIRENETRLKNVLDHLMIGILLIDQNKRFAIVNPSAERLLGYAAEAFLGRRFDEANQQPEFVELLQYGFDKKEQISDEIIFHYPLERHIEVIVVPLYSGDEEWIGSLVALHDISDIRRLERMRSEFVANVSHEIKTPIAAVKGFSETLLAGALDDRETAKSFLQIIHDESGRLDRLIADILHLSKIESKRITLDFSPIDLKAFIDKTTEMMKAEAELKHIKLDVRVPDELYVEADEDRLQQIVLNLISNAIHYTGEGGSVTVRVDQFAKAEAMEQEDWIRISVADTGLGIPKKDLPRIFERFYRVDKARSRSSGGTGLGLSIVKHLVELHHGHIEVRSELGFGSTFIVEIPVVQQ